MKKTIALLLLAALLLAGCAGKGAPAEVFLGIDARQSLILPLSLILRAR